MLCHQVTESWRHQCTKWQKRNPGIVLPEVSQDTRGKRRKVFRVLPIQEALQVGKQLVADGFHDITEEITALTASLGLQESDRTPEDEKVGEG